MVPKDDPTVLFTPAGMNQFKKEFMGQDCGFKRAATAQRCLRTDDLEKVGKTSAHHTFFEMLGNFSFGDYFKEEAIGWAWEFLTQELKISPEKLWISVYKDDPEAYEIWKEKIGIPVGKIVKLTDKDNFWPAEAKTKGPNGPCGPCSEIFYDFGSGVGCGEKNCDPSCACGRFVEIWNLVFTQFNRQDEATIEPLPNKNIDTGMGLERLTAIMQGKQNNFQTELFQPIIKEIQRSAEAETKDSARLLYAIADHIRAVVFSIYDGILPSNEGRGYVVRKIIRKSILHLNLLGIKEPFFYSLVASVAQIMRKPYPELTDRREEIAQRVLIEEKNFIHTLSSSEELFKNKFAGLMEKSNPETAGNIAFLLHDTYGIPLELTRQWLDEHKISFSHKAFQQAMDEQKARSKSGSAMKGDVFSVRQHAVEKLPKTQFLGFDQFETKAKVLEVIMNMEDVDLEGVVLDKTVFYAESGGQVNDIGTLSSGGKVFSVIDVQKIDDVFIHWGKKPDNRFLNQEIVDVRIDLAYRLSVARNHTATHLLQAALRQVLGNHVQQQGSLVNGEKLRFDFTHFKGLSKEEIAKVEEAANRYVTENYTVDSKEMDLKAAKKAGALAFFEEKYGEKVRVVEIGNISKELCGGTHLTNLQQIGLIKITSESSVASGIRRIEAVTGQFAQQFIRDQEQKAIAEAAKQKSLEELKAKEKKRGAERINSLTDRLPGLLEKSIKINGLNTIFSLEKDLDMQVLRLLADKIKEKLSCTVIVLGSADQEQKKAFLVIAVTEDLLSRGIDAGALIRQVAPIIGGSGGGRGDFAQAGGTHPENFTLAFEKLRDIIKSYL